MFEKALTYALWFAAPVLQALILVFMVRKKLRNEFPFFFVYTSFQILNVAILFTVYHLAQDLYFYAYWTTAALGIILGFAVIYEIFTYAIRPYTGLRDLGAMLFRWAAFLLVLVGALVAMSASGMDAKEVVSAIVKVEQSVRLMQVGLLLFICLCSSYLGFTWKNFASGIALGFGIFATADLVLFSLRVQLGTSWNSALSLFSSAAYNISVLIWAGYALMPARVQKRAHTQVAYRPVFDRWNQAALALVNPSAAPVTGHTYLTEIERTVDTILAKSVQSEEKAKKVG